MCLCSCSFSTFQIKIFLKINIRGMHLLIQIQCVCLCACIIVTHDSSASHVVVSVSSHFVFCFVLQIEPGTFSVNYFLSTVLYFYLYFLFLKSGLANLVIPRVDLNFGSPATVSQSTGIIAVCHHIFFKSSKGKRQHLFFSLHSNYLILTLSIWLYYYFSMLSSEPETLYKVNITSMPSVMFKDFSINDLNQH